MMRITTRSILQALCGVGLLLFVAGGANAQATTAKDGRVADPATAPAAANPPASGEETAPARPQRPWIVNCTNEIEGDDLACTMSQTVVARETNQRVISATIFRDVQSKALRMQLGLPHGLDLPAGVSVAVDADAPTAVPIKTADQNGSYALVDIDEALLGRMKAGQLLNVGMTSADGRAVTLQLSLTSFSASADKV